MVGGTILVNDGIDPLSVQHVGEEEPFPIPFPHIYSSRETNLLPWLVVSVHFRQVGSLNTAECLELQFYDQSSLSSVHVNTSVTKSLSKRSFTWFYSSRAIEVVNPPLRQGFCSHIFLVPPPPRKEMWQTSSYLIVPYSKIETIQSVNGSIHLVMWWTLLHVANTYFHSFLPILRFVWQHHV